VTLIQNLSIKNPSFHVRLLYEQEAEDQKETLLQNFFAPVLLDSDGFSEKNRGFSNMGQQVTSLTTH
jgi:hypothetical protein